MSRAPASEWKPGGKRERTRAALVSATLAVAEEKGFAGASLEEIAARAGMTKGAIYSNFASKAELMLAAMTAKGFVLAASSRAPAASLEEELSAMAGELSTLLERAKHASAFLAEFQLYALSDPELRKDFAAIYSESFTGTAAYLAGLDTSAMPPRDLAVALQAIALGFTLQALVTPADVTEDVVKGALQALAKGLAPAPRQAMRTTPGTPAPR